MKIEELLEITSKMTPGEWATYNESVNSESADIVVASDPNDRVASTCPQHEDGIELANGLGIVALKNHAPRIITELQAEVKELRDALAITAESYCESHCPSVKKTIEPWTHTAECVDFQLLVYGMTKEKWEAFDRRLDNDIAQALKETK